MLPPRTRSGSSGGAVRSTISIAGEMPAIAALAVSWSAPNVAADVHGDFRLGHGLDPAGKRYASSRLNAGVAGQKSGDVEALEHRRRGEAHLPAQRRVAGVKTLAPQLELRPHAAHDACILPEIHDPSRHPGQARR